MDSLLKRYKEKRPEVVFEWKDAETDAEGWVVINSLRGGAAGGGTRMREGLDKMEVMSLAKVMEIKFTVSGPAIGGAKSGINFNPRDPKKREVLKRWYKAVTPILKHYYGTGGDLNVDEVHDVIPITEDYGLWHPQEGIVNGHFNPKESTKIHLIGQLRQGVLKTIEDPYFTPDVSKKYTVADLITGWGVAESVKHYYDIYRNANLEGKRVIVQGWGNVAGPTAYYLAQNGAKVVGIIDRVGGLINTEGYSFDEVKNLVLTREGINLSHPQMLSFDEVNEKIWDVPADIFIPAAASKLVTQNNLERLVANGLESISCGANVAFKDDDIFFGDVAKYADEHTSLIPDFIANCGMARVFAYLMQDKAVDMTDAGIFDDVSLTTKNALLKSHKANTSLNGIAATALGQALEVLMK